LPKDHRPVSSTAKLSQNLEGQHSIATNLDAKINIRFIIKNIMTSHIVRTTIALPSQLLAATDLAVSQGQVKSRNELIAQALTHELAALKRAEIDLALTEMSQDPTYQVEVLKMEAEFATASWEALNTQEPLL
jgi:Arc/MetJ-type ribon-helix-helix transcriptional regulator